jgi:hypothetical protein
VRVLQGIRPADQRLDRWWRRQSFGIWVLWFAIVWTLLNGTAALFRSGQTDRWFSTFFGLTMIAIVAIGVAANRLRKRHRPSSLEK